MASPLPDFHHRLALPAVGGETDRATAVYGLIAETARRGWLDACYPLAAVFCVMNDLPDTCEFGISGPRSALPRLLPGYPFHEWAQVGAESYEAMVRRVVAASAAPPTEDVVFWAGAPTHPFREEAVAWAAGRAGFKLRLVTMADWPTLFTPLPAHARFAALLDVPGGGFSGRLPFLLATARPVIVVEREAEQWYYWEGLQPWVHYVPAAATTAALDAAWGWVRAHRGEAAAIGARAQRFVLQNLSTDAVHCRVARVLCPAGAAADAPACGGAAPAAVPPPPAAPWGGAAVALPLPLLLLLLAVATALGAAAATLARRAAGGGGKQAGYPKDAVV
jgi:hypothetical protein